MTDPLARLKPALADRHEIQRELGAGGYLATFFDAPKPARPRRVNAPRHVLKAATAVWWRRLARGI